MANLTSRYILPISAEKRIFRNSFAGFFSKDGEIKGCCCNCREKYCLKYSSQELHSDFFNSFPHNTSNRVCPTCAITNVGNGVSIDENKCIGCGICISRCPFSAFAYDANKGKCFVQDNEIKVSETIIEQEKQIEHFSTLPVSHNYQDISIPFINESALRIISNTDAPEIIVRNFLINLGITANTNTQGNQHNRIEFFALADEKYLIGECETSNDVLSVSRRILDDLAVLVSRYAINISDIIPLAVINRLPNKRTDFYEVIEDINKVLGVQINTISYACLFFLNLFDCKITVLDFRTFILNRKNSDLVMIIKSFIPNFSKVCTFENTDYFSVQK